MSLRSPQGADAVAQSLRTQNHWCGLGISKAQECLKARAHLCVLACIVSLECKVLEGLLIGMPQAPTSP